MAFRIHDSVVRGEIDNRVRGIVRGSLWLEGCLQPVVLELRGNAQPDLAGCLLTFTNPLERVSHAGLDSLHPVQRGSIGDLTASRKVRVPAVPLAEFLNWPKEKAGRPRAGPTAFTSNGSARRTAAWSSKVRIMRSKSPRRNGA